LAAILSAMFAIGASFFSIAFLGEQSTARSWCLDPPSATLANCKTTYTVYERVPGGFTYFGPIGFYLIFFGFVATFAITVLYGVFYLRSLVATRLSERRRRK